MAQIDVNKYNGRLKRDLKGLPSRAGTLKTKLPFNYLRAYRVSAVYEQNIMDSHYNTVH